MYLKNLVCNFIELYMQVACSMCSETMDRDILDVHKGENCPKRIVTCEFCEFPLPAVDLAEHQVLLLMTSESGIFYFLLMLYSLISICCSHPSGSLW